MAEDIRYNEHAQKSGAVSEAGSEARVVPRSVTVVMISATIAAVLIIGLPVLVTVFQGAAPYDRLFRSFPGLLTGVSTSVLRSAAETSALVTIGALAYALFLRVGTSRATRTVEESLEITVLRVAAGLWSGCAGLLVVFTAFDANGVSVERLAEPNALPFLWSASDAPKAWTVAFLASTVVFFASFVAARWTGLLVPMGAAMIGALAPVVSGQVLVGPNHDFGGDAAVFQTIGVVLFFGVLAVLLVRSMSGRLIAIPTLRRTAAIAMIAVPVIVVTEGVLTVFKLAGTGLFDSVTGGLMLARWLCLAAIIVAAALYMVWVRRGVLRESRIYGLLLVSGFAVAGWIGVSVAMTREPPPQYFVPTSISQVFLGFDLPEAPGMTALLTQWRPNLLFVGVSAAAVSVYLVAVRMLSRRGDRWPAGRTAAWIVGWTLVVIATSSGFGKYSGADFGVHMIVHMSLNMLAPAILTLGGVVTLLLRATSAGGPLAGAHEWLTRVLKWRVLHFLYNPLLVFVLFVGSYYGLYLTGLFGELMRFHWGHQLMNVHFLVVGYLYYSLIIGIDKPPRSLPHVGKLGFVLAAMPFHAFFGVILMTGSGGDTLIAENFYRYLSMPWADLPASQAMGGGVAWAGGEIPLMIVVIILGIQWARQDSREARRKDRHMDAGLDPDFDQYNAMLARLSNTRSTADERGGEER
ncbi:cytochrome c oxidase assembly protein [Microbacterium sp. SY138]|uniref:cytochrome c oxidase assembly protein n=1 Tax=unclassified Microbacterium TaxID=2609290 RepID=UPI003219D4E1